MTDEAFAQFCAEHPDLDLEMSANGELIIKPQTYTWTGARSGEIMGQLHYWARRDKRGIAFDSSTGWLLPTGARRSARCGLDTQAADQGSRPRRV